MRYLALAVTKAVVEGAAFKLVLDACEYGYLLQMAINSTMLGRHRDTKASQGRLFAVTK
jgi:hypothetical protein